MAMIFIYAQSAPAASELASFARENGYESTVLCFSPDQVDALTSCGADRVLCFSGESRRPESYAGQVAQLLIDRSCALFLVSASARARELAAMVAGRLEWPMANDVLEAALRPEGVIVKRMMYGGAVVQTECYSGPAALVIPEGSCADSDIDNAVFTPNRKSQCAVAGGKTGLHMFQREINNYFFILNGQHL